jgi:murein DD-endopeptidase MepM/ murein hydrolase activator NlpD
VTLHRQPPHHPAPTVVWHHGTGGRHTLGRKVKAVPQHASAHHAAVQQPGTMPQLSTSGLTVGGFSVDPFTSAQLSKLAAEFAGTDQPPAFLIPIYKAAGRRYDVPWRILAAINAIETDFGRNLNVSSAGAIGWMQFMPGTWLQYGVAVGDTHRPDPYDPRDAIFTAARYLAANGAARDIRGAVFAYNHALWYVDAVMWRAQTISSGGGRQNLHGSGYALPLDGRYMHQLGRTDDGVDIETAPDGAAVYAITPGVITAVASDPGGFGPNYPVELVTAGPLAGQYIYYGHVAASLVTVGQHVLAGQPVAVMGHTGDAASLGHGHIEIGFSTSGGDPLDHHGSEAWTPSGAAMREVLVSLSAGFGIKTS